MSRIEFSYRSAALGYRTTVTAIVPSIDWIEMMRGVPAESFYERKYPTLWLLHGTSGDNDCWTRFTRLESWAEQNRIAVVMPDCRLSAFCDMDKGPAFYTYVTEELPAVCRSILPLLRERHDNFIGGLSMGGYGALKIALRNPDAYSLVLNFSGGVDRVAHVESTIRENRLTGLHNLTAMRATFGDLTKVAGGVNDVFALAESLARSERPKPKIYTSIGTRDPHWDENVRLRALLIRNDYEVYWEQGPFIHDWTNWNHYLEPGLQWAARQWSGSAESTAW